MKTIDGNAIYMPSGKAGEYSYCATNFYVGCSNRCTYCFLKKGLFKKYLGGDKPTLKSCFKNEDHALEVFSMELQKKLAEIKKHGTFLSFTTDCFLKETIDLTMQAIIECTSYGVPVKLLTKRADFINKEFFDDLKKFKVHLIAFGFTLTGHDELELGASTNTERIEAMIKLHDAGFKTFASIEPIIDFKSSYDMILKSYSYCDLFKIGLLSGKKYDKRDLNEFIKQLTENSDKPLYFKDSMLKQAGIERKDLPNNCVGRDYNIWK